MILEGFTNGYPERDGLYVFQNFEGEVAMVIYCFKKCKDRSWIIAPGGSRMTLDHFYRLHSIVGFRIVIEEDRLPGFNLDYLEDF